MIEMGMFCSLHGYIGIQKQAYLRRSSTTQILFERLSHLHAACQIDGNKIGTNTAGTRWAQENQTCRFSTSLLFNGECPMIIITMGSNLKAAAIETLDNINRNRKMKYVGRVVAGWCSREAMIESQPSMLLNPQQIDQSYRRPGRCNFFHAAKEHRKRKKKRFSSYLLPAIYGVHNLPWRCDVGGGAWRWEGKLSWLGFQMRLSEPFAVNHQRPD